MATHSVPACICVSVCARVRVCMCARVCAHMFMPVMRGIKLPFQDNTMFLNHLHLIYVLKPVKFSSPGTIFLF